MKTIKARIYSGNKPIIIDCVKEDTVKIVVDYLKDIKKAVVDNTTTPHVRLNRIERMANNALSELGE